MRELQVVLNHSVLPNVEGNVVYVLREQDTGLPKSLRDSQFMKDIGVAPREIGYAQPGLLDGVSHTVDTVCI